MKLTKTQQEAIDTTANRTVVIAGAGAGKTRVMIERIVSQMLHGADVHDFLVLTFTRKAAHEMTVRLAKRLEQNGWGSGSARQLRPMMIGTFHALALRMLRTDGERLGFDPDRLTVALEDDVTLLLTQVCRDLGFLRGTNWRDGMSKTTLQTSLHEYYTGETGLGELAPNTRLILEEYWGRLREMNVLDFGLLLRTVQQQLLTECPDVLERYQQRFKHVVIEEAQDLNELQHGWPLFFCPPASLFMVADLRQAIYEWNGARPSLLRDVMQREDVEIIQLSSCFRCGDEIVGVANELISQDDYGADPMTGDTGRRGRVETLTGHYSDVAERVQSLMRREFYKAEDIVLMARTHKTLEKAEAELRAAGMRTYRVGSIVGLLDSENFKKLHAAMRLAVNHQDNLAFLRLLNEFGLESTQYAMVRSRAVVDRTGHFDAMVKLFGGGELGQTISQCGGESGGEDPADPFAQEIELLVAALGAGGMDASGSIDYWRSYNPRSIRDALDCHALRDAQDDVKQRPGCVTLLTIHAAKGLEWPCVIVLGMNEGRLPHSRAVRSGNIREERRLAYVAWTRAAERLVLHWQAEDDGWDETMAEPSRFLIESGITIETAC